jgi:twinkle protein
MQKIKDSDIYQVPSLYDVSGSSNFYNKSDNGLVVYRDFASGQTIVNILKVKFSHWGETSQSIFKYDLASGRYYNDEYTRTEKWIK